MLIIEFMRCSNTRYEAFYISFHFRGKSVDLWPQAVPFKAEKNSYSYVYWSQYLPAEITLQHLSFKWVKSPCGQGGQRSDSAGSSACCTITLQQARVWARLLHLKDELSEQQSILPLHHPNWCHVVFGTERYLKMKQMNDAQSSQPSAFMNHLMKLSNKSQVDIFI